MSLSAASRISAERFVSEVRKEFCALFLDAIDKKDSRKLYEIAQSVENAKKYDAQKQGDRMRAAILTLKKMLDSKNEKWSLKELAAVIGQESDPNNLRLYKLCVELNFPLSKSNTFKKKN